MNYISTKETAEKWGMSARTVNRLAKEGKIPGAKLVGKTWLIPEDAKVHIDGRTKSQKQTKEVISSKSDNTEERFIFPIFVLANESELNDDERLLLNAQKLYLQGYIEESHREFERLLNYFTEDYLKIGTIYMLIYTSVLLSKHSLGMSYYRKGLAILKISKSKYKKELSFLFTDITNVFVPLSSKNITTFNINDTYHPSFANFYLLGLHFLSVLGSTSNISAINYELLEATIFQLKSNGNQNLAHMLNTLLIFIFQYTNSPEMCKHHIREALSFVSETGYIIYISFIYQFASLYFDEIFDEYDPSLKNKIIKLSNQIHKNWALSGKHISNDNPFFVLTCKEMEIVNYVTANYTNKEIAQLMSSTVSSVSNRLNTIYQKLNIKNRKELIQLRTQIFNQYKTNLDGGE